MGGGQVINNIKRRLEDHEANSQLERFKTLIEQETAIESARELEK